ncbi:MAG: cytidylate kinase-like family protein [Cyclobacteriaceae bacterium]|nr:cytidylate kinase-like family protein [Cyclobacteriaceae bacterium]
MGATFLSKYLNARFTREVSKSDSTEQKRVVVTLSRDTGCDAVQIVEETIKQLNNALKGENKNHGWQFVSKEIFEKSARELNVKLDIFDKLESTSDKGLIEDLLQSFSNEKYPSEYKIKKTYKEVIQSVARNGNVIILGRAGVAIVKHNRRNLHIKLTAPLDWRVQKVAKENNITEAKALKHIKESDEKRQKFKKYYMGRKVDITDYDLVLNVSSLTKREICSALVSMIQEKSK